MKARRASEAKTLQDVPNIGPAMAADFRTLGIQTPAELKGKNPYALYRKICRLTGTRHDPCVLDTYMAAIDFMNGAPARPWHAYTQKRKQEYPDT